MICHASLECYLENKFKVSRKLHKASIKNPSEENIHDLRVSLRRLIVVLDFIAFLNDNDKKQQNSIKRIRKETKRYLKLLSPLRDLQVQILHLKSDPMTNEILLDFQKVLQKKEQKKLKKLPEHLSKWSLKKLHKAASKVVQKHLFNPREIEMKATLYLHYLTDQLHHSIAQTSEHAESYHKTRIALKKYRYFLEFLEQGFNLKQDLLPYLKQWQDRLGHLQDCIVLIAFLDALGSNDSYDIVLLKKKLVTEVYDKLPIIKKDLYELKYKTHY